MKIKYKNYFKNHYGYTFKEDNLRSYRKWFYSQWNIINKFLKNIENKNCLEIGSGIGGFYQFINGCPLYEGIELDNNAVKFANKHWDTSVFSNISLEEYKAKKKFDYVFAFEVLEHLDNPSNSVRKIYNLMNNDGLFIGTTPFPFVKNILADETHLSVLHPENWKRLFFQTGFSEIKIIPLSFLPFLWRVNKNINIRIPFYISFPGFISTCLIIAKK